MNVTARCRRHFPAGVRDERTGTVTRHADFDQFLMDWNIVVISATEEIYTERLAQLKENYEIYPGALGYVQRIWLEPYRECFVACYIDKYQQFGL